MTNLYQIEHFINLFIKMSCFGSQMPFFVPMKAKFKLLIFNFTLNFKQQSEKFELVFVQYKIYFLLNVRRYLRDESVMNVFLVFRSLVVY